MMASKVYHILQMN